MTDVASGALLVAGSFFFFAGTVGLLRFPDIYCRLHALTKADNLGLGLVVAGLAFQPMSWPDRAQLVLIWLLGLVAAATTCHLLARSSLRRGIRPWSSNEGSGRAATHEAAKKSRPLTHGPVGEAGTSDERSAPR